MQLSAQDIYNELNLLVNQVSSGLSKAKHLSQEYAQQQQQLILDRNTINNGLSDVEMMMQTWQNAVNVSLSGMDAASNQLLEWKDDLSAKIDIFQKEVDGAVNELNQFTDQILEGVNNVGQEMTNKINEVMDNVGERITDLDTLKNEIDKEFLQSSQLLEETDQFIVQQQTDFNNYLTEKNDQLIEEYQKLFDELTSTLVEKGKSLVQDYSGHIQDVLDIELINPLKNSTNEATSQVEEFILAEVDLMLQDIVDKFDELRGEIFESNASSEVVREMMKPLIDNVQDLINPLESLVEGVKSICNAVGISI